jgi:hypothetical protein
MTRMASDDYDPRYVLTPARRSCATCWAAVGVGFFVFMFVAAIVVGLCGPTFGRPCPAWLGPGIMMLWVGLSYAGVLACAIALMVIR